MPETQKPTLRKRTITGWRHLERKLKEIRTRHRTLPIQSKRAV